MSQRAYNPAIERKHVFTWSGFIMWCGEHSRAHPEAMKLTLDQLQTAWSHVDDDPDLLDDAGYSHIYRMYVDAFGEGVDLADNDLFGCETCGKVDDIDESQRIGGRKGILVCEGCHAESEASGTAYDCVSDRLSLIQERPEEERCKEEEANLERCLEWLSPEGGAS